MKCETTSSVKECALRARSTHGVQHAIVEVNIVIGVVLGEVLVARVVAMVLMFLRSKRLPDHNQVRDPCWGSRCADTLHRPDALRHPGESAGAVRAACTRSDSCARHDRWHCSTRATSFLRRSMARCLVHVSLGFSSPFTLWCFRPPVGGDLLLPKMSHSDMTQFAVSLPGHYCQCCRRVHHDGRRHGDSD